MLADLQCAAEQQLANIKQLVAQEQYAAAAESVGKWQKQIEPLFAQISAEEVSAAQRLKLRQLSEDFFALLSKLNQDRQQIKDSISQIAAVKSGNKISKTYQTE